ncbi:hypothetical protein M8J75_013892 [Diaphorina citri]|nr:hypothetical protein M8J75_013892 [Diaphorina citri]
MPQLSRMTNDEVKLRVFSGSIGGIDESAEYKKLLINLSPDVYYLENTGVTPLLVDALKHLDDIRPPDPIEFIAAYILLNKGLYDGNPLYEHMDNDTSDLIHEPEEPQPQDENENDVTAEKNQSKV